MIKQDTLTRRAGIAYYVSTAFLIASKSFPHAVLTVLLLHKGLDLTEIMFVQTAFTIAVFLFEFPSGVISDLYSRKIVYLTSILAWVAACSVIIFGTGFAMMCVAWALYGIGEALASGTVDASLINLYKRLSPDPDEEIKTFKRISNQISMVSMIIGAMLGSALYFTIGYNIYAVAMALACAAALPIVLAFPKDEHDAREKKPTIMSQVRDGLSELRKDRRLTFLIGMAAVSQIFFQTHFNLWQAYLLLMGVKDKYLFVFYLVFQVIGIAAYAIHIDGRLRRLLYLGIPVALIMPLLITSGSRIVSIGAYCISVFIFMFLQYMCDVLFSIRVSEERISTLITLNSTTCRIIGFLVLGLNGLLLKQIKLTTLIVGSFEIATFLSILLGLLFMLSFSKKKKKQHTEPRVPAPNEPSRKNP